MSDQDMSQFLAIFIDEGREQLDLLENGFLQLETRRDEPELLQDLFRAAHTLKGSSKAMGFSAMGDLTHRMEDLLDAVRQAKLPVTTELISTILACVDMLKQQMDGIANEGSDAVADVDTFASLLAQLAQMLAGQPATPSKAAPVKATTALEEPATLLGENQLRFQVTLSPECEFRAVRAYMVLAAAEEMGEVLETNPTRALLEEEAFEFTFVLTVATEKDADEFIAKLLTVPEVAEVVVPDANIEPEAPVEVATAAGPQTASNPEAKSAPQAKGSSAPAPHSQSIRVDVNRLDALLNLVGELVTDRTQMANLCGTLQARYHGDDLVSDIAEATMRIARVTGELQDEIMKTRMMPIDNAFQRMPRVMRDLAQNLGKQIKLDISGGDTEIDRSIIDALTDPLIHLIRNSVDHGVEEPEARQAAGKPAEGLVRLTARHEENNIVIEISDDGKGIDPIRVKRKAVESGLISEAASQAMSDADACRLIFAPGLSTAKEVSEVSGRGVGMDIVKTNLEKIGGRIDLESKQGAGTKFTIRLPLTLAIMRALLVEAGEVTYAVPLCSIVETLRLGSGEGQVRREKLSGRAAMVLRGQTVPLTNLEHLLEQSHEATKAEKIAIESCVVVVGAGSGQVGLCVDSLKGEQEIVVKPLGRLLGDIHGISGASILGDGHVALIVDPAKAMVGAA